MTAVTAKNYFSRGVFFEVTQKFFNVTQKSQKSQKFFKVTQKAAIKREKSQTCLDSSEREQARRSQITEITEILY